jgi:hypothetical protein
LLIPTTVARVHVKVTPVVLLVGVYVNGVLLHTADGEVVLVNIGVGLTVTFTLYVLGFVQAFAVSVYTYVTTIGSVVVLVKTSLGLPVPLPAALLIPDTVARVHANVVPEVPLVGV